ncbi:MULTISPECIES: YjjG family noncanonical pyrimidine nucleotidase [unclassified Sinorhizobium]|uniref:YjjG family noncanonical pyrimidine nucleotidase n=1 Tax=unclassified Sinorhizobium TaxID=2613772 RepID=UPI0024C4540A|nr:MULTISPECIES: YjjG family noncanonical pyrimidine nucleotidase [unclassified Sinorhizobium]MDK1376513.1 YjjG family noncanonical pyrimidine nucleotidase [Sinorhizobium sp. 6-70]MDK1482111.1 YjjG family noncanonical pyrimidine nucleotidase [Sinorhizobium sp. 6-117]
MKYRRFLFDLDDTLLDFKASERLSFSRALSSLGIDGEDEPLFADYQRENMLLWSEFEKGMVRKEILKVERFRRVFEQHGIDANPETASARYLQFLPETVVLVEGAAEICERLAGVGEVAIITNGIEAVQAKRIENSGLGQWLSFVATSETCGFAKPDIRFFEHAASRFRTFNKEEAIIVGDRLDADILGANRFGIESCWFNPLRAENRSLAVPTIEVARLSEIAVRLAGG